MKPIMTLLGAAAAAAIGLSAGTARADEKTPKFEFGKAEELKEVKKVEWKASAQAGVILTTGNSRTTTGAAGATASRKEGNNKLSLEATGAYARSSILIAVDGNADGVIEESEVTRNKTTATRAWGVKGRYDRFLTEHNSLYVTGVVSGDKPAGKEFVGGGQAGYSRLLYKSDRHEVTAEAGYDFSYENLVVGPGVSIHSARFFVGYDGKLTADTGIKGSVESLHNVNSLDSAAGKVDPLEDTRINGSLALTTKLLDNISFWFGFTAKFDNAPAPRPPLPGFGWADPLPLADKLDTKTEATLIVNFL